MAGPAAGALQQQQAGPPQPPQRVTKEMLIAAMKLIGFEATDAHINLMLPGVNRALNGYEQLRKIDIPLDTEPAFWFHPGTPDKVPPAGPARFRPTARTAKGRTWKTLEDVAFWPVTELAPLLRGKLVTSTDLTKMYLDRLKRFGPKLLCVITLTEDLALQQAAEADREIRAGRYRGPLHGIPWGAKDLFATKGIPTTWGAEPFRDCLQELLRPC